MSATTQTYAAAMVDALHDALSADRRVSLIGSHVLGLGPQRHLMSRIRQDFPDRILDPPTAEAGAAAVGFLAWSQLVNEAAVAHYMTAGRVGVPVTFHMLHGVRGGGAAQHSHS